MKTDHSSRFHDERVRFALAHTCEDCVYFDVRGGACSHGYPNESHRREAFEQVGASKGMFCKEFELV